MYESSSVITHKIKHFPFIFLQGSYSLPSSSIFVDPKESIPSWLEKGEYQAQATLKQKGQELFCMKIYLSIEPANWIPWLILSTKWSLSDWIHDKSYI